MFWNGRNWDGAVPPPPSADVKREGRAKHVAKAAAEAGLITALAFGLIAGSTFAAKPGGGSTGTGRHGGGGGTAATIAVADGVFGQTTTAQVSPAGLWVYASCSQGGQQVYAQYMKSDASGAAV